VVSDHHHHLVEALAFHFHRHHVAKALAFHAHVHDHCRHCRHCLALALALAFHANHHYLHQGSAILGIF